MPDQYHHQGTQVGDTPTPLTFPSPNPIYVQAINDNPDGGDDLLVASDEATGGEFIPVKPGEIYPLVSPAGRIAEVTVNCAPGETAVYRVRTCGKRA